MKLEYLSGIELGKEVNSGNLTPTEIVHYFEKRIKERNPSLNAFTYLKIEDALNEAKLLEERIAKGENVGPLAGVPVGLKDFLPSKKGWTNSHGGVKSLIREDDIDSEFYKAARAAGAIAIGKTNAPAFAFRGTCDNKLYGPTANPFNTAFNSGGSSGGSAAAVADGMLPIAEGSDGGGSIRIPSAWCSCFGFKASVGTIPSVCRPDGWTATHPYCFNGAITRTVEDSALMLEYMARYDARDPLSIDHGFRSFRELMKMPIKGWNIALTLDFDMFPVDKEVATIVESAAHLLESAGANVDYVHFDFKHSFNDYAKLWCRSISVDTAIDMELWKKEGLDLLKDHKDELPDEFIYWNDMALKSGILDYRYFNELRTEMYDELQNILDEYQIILSPVTICPPVKNADDCNTKGPREVNGVEVEQLIGFCETFMANFTGNPAASVPAGVTKEGLPVGMQIIGRKYKDEDVLAVAHAFEEIAPWSYEKAYDRLSTC
jgi:amidase/aspartyl-tRNA(Asn)/glutamyl-tRNA(Gln) amidotransferase subunit A